MSRIIKSRSGEQFSLFTDAEFKRTKDAAFYDGFTYGIFCAIVGIVLLATFSIGFLHLRLVVIP